MNCTLWSVVLAVPAFGGVSDRPLVCHLILHLPNSTAPICPLQHDLIGTARHSRVSRGKRWVIIVTGAVLRHVPNMHLKTRYYLDSSQNLLLWLVDLQRLPISPGFSASNKVLQGGTPTNPTTLDLLNTLRVISASWNDNIMNISKQVFQTGIRKHSLFILALMRENQCNFNIIN